MPLEHMSPATFKNLFSENVLRNINQIVFNGSYGDPLVSPHLFECLDYLKDYKKPIIHIHTNGGMRQPKYFDELANKLKDFPFPTHVVFSIDGLEDTNHLYRRNVKWNKVMENAQAFLDAGGLGRWRMLVFEHNEHQVEEARQMAQHLGFKTFTTKHTSRFKGDYLQVIDEQGKPLHKLRPTEKSSSMIPLVEQSQKETKPTIVCKAVKYKQIYVSACGNVSPCCWLDMEWIPPMQESRIDYMKRIGEFPNLNTSSLEEIFENKEQIEVSKFYEKLPKAHAIAIDNWLTEKIYHRKPEQEK